MHEKLDAQKFIDYLYGLYDMPPGITADTFDQAMAELEEPVGFEMIAIHLATFIDVANGVPNE